MDFSQSPRLVDLEESAVDLTRKIAVYEDEYETDYSLGDLGVVADHLVTPSNSATGVTVGERRYGGSRWRSIRVRPQDAQRQVGRGGRHTRAVGSAALLHHRRGHHHVQRIHRTTCPVNAPAEPRRSPARVLRDALELWHAVRHYASQFQETFRDIAPTGTWRGSFGGHPAARQAASHEDLTRTRPAGVDAAVRALSAAAAAWAALKLSAWSHPASRRSASAPGERGAHRPYAPLQPVGARIVHEAGLPLPMASQTVGS